ncbi:MAG: CPBP family intramembrane metalloprotease [Microlunatus sp.]|nr:CPBP family intramembrane metalloprotease [Microlunatus sp.]MDN5769831.1 CPBP family intramembrane metalloprotease [Microlunatus sp.]
MGRHRFLAFVVLAYGISWSLWLVAANGGGQVPFLLGALGPMAAAAIVTVWSGQSLVTWIRPLWRWRVPVRWWIYALGLPALLYAVVTLILQIIGSPVDWSLSLDRLPSYLSTFVFVLFLGGGLEEPGWRGFGLPVLQERHSPLLATVVLGLVWGVWHIPVYGLLGFVVPWILAFFYTVLWNATGSLLLCILLHASFTPAQDNLILLPQEQAYTTALDNPDWAILATYLLAALIIVALTHGRLGLRGSGGRLVQPASRGDRPHRVRGDDDPHRHGCQPEAARSDGISMGGTAGSGRSAASDVRDLPESKHRWKGEDLS